MSKYTYLLEFIEPTSLNGQLTSKYSLSSSSRSSSSGSSLLEPWDNNRCIV